MIDLRLKCRFCGRKIACYRTVAHAKGFQCKFTRAVNAVRVGIERAAAEIGERRKPFVIIVRQPAGDVRVRARDYCEASALSARFRREWGNDSVTVEE